MKRIVFLLIIALMQCTLAGAREYKVSTGYAANIVIDIPDSYECAYENNDIRNPLQYILKKADGTEVEVIMICLDLKKSKAHEIPDTLILPALKNAKIVERTESADKNKSRTITIQEKNKKMRKNYIKFFNMGILVVSVSSPNSDFSESDSFMQTADTKTMWKKMLLSLIGIFVAIIPGIILATAWDYRKTNATIFWRRTILSIIVTVLISVALSLYFSISFWIILLIYAIINIVILLMSIFNLIPIVF